MTRKTWYQLLVLVTLLSSEQRILQAPSATHQVTLVTIAHNVKLETVDWGGRGPALVFLAGFGDTGHVFDSFARQFTKQHHVYAITRRGFGASSRPSAGYDTPTLSRDIIAVLDSLGVRRATFVGHSFAGTELDYLGACYSDRAARLVYVDASYDFARLYRDTRWQNAFPVPKPPAPANTGLRALRQWFALVTGPVLPDDEIRQLTSGAGSAPDTMLQQGVRSCQAGNVRAPVLAFWAMPRSVEDAYPYWKTLSSHDRSRLSASFQLQQVVRREHWQAFRKRLPGACLVEVARARHFIFFTHPLEVAAGIRGFLAGDQERGEQPKTGCPGAGRKP